MSATTATVLPAVIAVLSLQTTLLAVCAVSETGGVIVLSRASCIARRKSRTVCASAIRYNMFTAHCLAVVHSTSRPDLPERTF